MAEETQEEDLMSIFGDNDDLELNLDEFENPEQDEEEGDDDPSKKNNDQDDDQNPKPNEDDQDDDSEKVVGDEDQDDEGDDSSDDSADDDSPDIYSSFANVLNEQGLLPSLDSQGKPIKSLDDLTTALKSEIENQSKSFIVEKLGEEGYEALQKGVTLAEYQQYHQDTEALDQLDEETLSSDLELAKKVILEDYKAQGFPEDRAMRILKKSIDLGDEEVLNDAKESLNSLKQVQKQKLENLAKEREQAAQQAAKEQEKIDNDLKNSIYNSDEIIEGIKLNKEIKDKVYQSITKPIGKSPQGTPENKLMRHRRESPIEFDTKLYYLYEATNGFKDFTKIKSKVGSKVTDDFEKALRKNKRFENSSAPDFVNDKESYGGIGDELNL